jgi:hypothetical protein
MTRLKTTLRKDVPAYRAMFPRVAMAVAVLATAFSAGGCSSAAPAKGTDIEDVHLDVIREVVPDGDLEYKRVTVPGRVKTIISPSAFSIKDADKPSVDDLLILHKNELTGVKPGASVNVTGIVYRGFDVAEVKKETGIDLDQSLSRQWQGDSYIVASDVQPR